MKKLVYIFTLCTILLSACSQDEAIMENKGELVTLHYDVAIMDDALSRTSSEEVVVNKLLCVIFEGDDEVKREIIEKDSDGKFRFSPKLFGNVEYHVVFWAYYSADNTSCFNMTDVSSICINDYYGKGNFQANKYKDAFTAVDVIKLAESSMNTSITLRRPFAKLNVLLSKKHTDEYKSQSGKELETCHIVLNGCKNTFNALSQTWLDGTVTLTIDSDVKKASTVYYEGYTYYESVGEYLFANGNLQGGSLMIDNEDGEVIYGNTKLQDIPFDANKETNIYINLY